MIRSPNFFDDFARMTAVEKMEGGEEAPENSSSVRGGESDGEEEHALTARIESRSMGPTLSFPN